MITKGRVVTFHKIKKHVKTKFNIFPMTSTLPREYNYNINVFHYSFSFVGRPSKIVV